MDVEFKILYQDDFLFVREDMALGISVYSKNPYARIKIYGMSKEKPENAKMILGEAKYNQIAKQVGVEGGKGHDYYEKYRVLVVGKDDKQRKQIEQESKKYYSKFL